MYITWASALSRYIGMLESQVLHVMIPVYTYYIDDCGILLRRIWLRAYTWKTGLQKLELILYAF